MLFVLVVAACGIMWVLDWCFRPVRKCKVMADKAPEVVAVPTKEDDDGGWHGRNIRANTSGLLYAELREKTTGEGSTTKPAVSKVVEKPKRRATNRAKDSSGVTVINNNINNVKCGCKS